MKSSRTPLPAAGVAMLALGLAAPVHAQAVDENQPVQVAQATTEASATNLDQVVVTGSRQARSAGKSSSPIDVISAKELQNLGASTATEALNLILPSFSLPAQPGQDQSSIIRSASLRGLNGDQTLVLVNGKRRHNSAVVNTFSNLNRGSQPVDLDLIPFSAIDHIEVLRDGASAQYGSDAIAGVINIILKGDDSGGSITSKTGIYGFQDGFTNQEGINSGYKIGNGFLNLSAEFFVQRHTNRSADAEGPFYYPLPNGQPDPRELTTDPNKIVDGLPDTRKFAGSYNFSLPINSNLTFYTFGTYAHRNGVGYENFRFANNSTGLRNPTACPDGVGGTPDNPYCQAYPDGFEPHETIEENDIQFLAGIKGKDLFGWAWDFSSTYGKDDASIGVTDSLNASLGAVSQRSFYDGSWIFTQLTNNFDLTRQFAIGLADPLNVSLGTEYRNESYTIKPGEPASYAGPTGPSNVPDPNNPGGVISGGLPRSGAQSYSGFRPSESGRDYRDNYAVYLDLETKLLPKWDVGLAGRYEYYNDAGNTVTGKLSTRYQAIDQFAVRGTVSNGFRAPGIAQGLLSSTSTFFAFNPVQNRVVGFDSGLVQPTSDIGRALGAQPLKPETSTNYSVGFIATPIKDLDITADLYRIYVRNRIAITGFISEDAYPGVDALVVAAGGEAGGSFQYFTNAISTRTQGVDIVANYRTRFGKYGTVRWIAEANWNQTTIQGVRADPQQISQVTGASSLFDVPSQSYLTVATPRTKLIVGGTYTKGPLDFNLHLIRFGHVTDYQSFPVIETVPARWITNVSANIKFAKSFSFGIGADNLFNLYPPETSNEYRGALGPNSGSGYGGFGKRSPFSPYGFSGGFYYAKLGYQF